MIGADRLSRSAYAWLGAFLVLVASTVGLQAQQAAVTVRLDGIDIDFDASGNWSVIYSTYSQPVTFPDRRGIRTATTIAEERAKAQITRYFEEKITSETIVEEVQRESENAIRTRSDAGDGFSAESQRNMELSIRQFSRSYSEGVLRGVVRLEQGYDEDAEEAWVKVGISRQTVGIAVELERDIANPEAAANRAAEDAARRRGGGGNLRQRSETRTRQMPGTPSNQVPTLAGEPNLADAVSVVDVEFTPLDSGQYQITGTLRNESLEAGYELAVTFTLRGESEQPVGSASTYLSVGRPGSSQMFRMVVGANGAVASYTHEVSRSN